MNLEIITPDKKLFEGDIERVKVPGEKGSFSVLNNHAPLISTLSKGLIRIVTTKNEISEIEVKGGVIEIKNNNIIILADV